MEGTADHLAAVGRALRRRFAHALLQWEISPGQARALRIIAEAETPVRLSALAEMLRIVPRSATEVVDALEERGLVRRLPDPDDRRATGVVLTEDGRRLRGEIERARTRAGESFLAPLTSAQRAELEEILVLLLREV